MLKEKWLAKIDMLQKIANENVKMITSLKKNFTFENIYYHLEFIGKQL